jgi:capsular exopolysaccharide synthesis family protein
VSRIDEALRRTGQGRPDKTFGDGQGVFVSAWRTEEEARSEEPAAAPPVVVAPSVVASPAIAEEREWTPDPAWTRDRMLPAEPQRTESGRSPVALSSKWRERLAVAPEANQMLVEQYRRLAATLHHAQSGSGIRVIMLTSASSDDGKTLTSVNLALVLSESYRRRVLLIDADLRRPSLGNVADVTNAPGLSEALKSPTDTKLALLEVTPTLMLLPAGRPDPDPMGGLTSPRMRHILEEAASRFDWVILDAPPMGPMADASLLSQMVDGAVFVVRAGRTQYQLVQKAIDALGRERILGVVLNGAEHMPAEQYEYGYGKSNGT